MIGLTSSSFVSSQYFWLIFKSLGFISKYFTSESYLIVESVSSQEREIPEYLEVDTKEFKGRFLRAPLMHDVPYPVTMEPNLVIEYYSR